MNESVVLFAVFFSLLLLGMYIFYSNRDWLHFYFFTSQFSYLFFFFHS